MRRILHVVAAARSRSAIGVTSPVSGTAFGWLWAVPALVLLPLSFLAALFMLEKQAKLLVSIRGVLRLAWLRSDIEALVDERKKLVIAVRTTVDRYSDPDIRRTFDASDFG